MIVAFDVTTSKPDEVINGAAKTSLEHFSECCILCIEDQIFIEESTDTLRFAVASSKALNEVAKIVEVWLKDSDPAATLCVGSDSLVGPSYKEIKKLIKNADEPVPSREVIYINIYTTKHNNITSEARAFLKEHYLTCPICIIDSSLQKDIHHFIATNPRRLSPDLIARLLSQWLENTDSEVLIQFTSGSVNGGDVVSVNRALRSAYNPRIFSNNPVEKVHLDTILGAQANHPLDLLILNQVNDLLITDSIFYKTYQENTAQFEKWVNEAKNYSPSRFELLHNINLYMNAQECISAGIQMTNDTIKFNEYQYDFKIVTNPSSDMNAYVAKKGMGLVHPSYTDALESDGKPCYIIWFHLGLYYHTIYNIRRFLMKFMYDQEDIQTMMNRLASYSYASLEQLVQTDVESDEEYAEDLFDTIDTKEWIPELKRLERAMLSAEGDSPLGQAMNYLHEAVATFIAGHESAHFLLGHTGHFPRRSVFSKEFQSKFQPYRLFELEADWLGFILMHDGCNKAKGIPVDISCIGPWMHTTAIVAIARIKQNYDSARLMEERLLCSIYLALEMFEKIGFERQRRDQIARVARALVWLQYQLIFKMAHRKMGTKRNVDEGMELFEALTALIEGKGVTIT